MGDQLSKEEMLMGGWGWEREDQLGSWSGSGEDDGGMVVWFRAVPVETERGKWAERSLGN